MKRFFLVLLCLLCLMTMVTGCENDEKGPDMTQEEFKMKYITMLEDMAITCFDGANGIVLEIDDDLYIWPEDLKIKLHVYAWVGDSNGTVPTADEVITFDEVIELYSDFDEAVFEKFEKFYLWNSRDGGEKLYKTYRSGIQTVYALYIDDNGKRINSKEFFTELTFEDYLELEAYIKENPHFEEEDKDYQKVLKWLGIEKPAEKS